MATIVGQKVGFALGGPIGGAVGAMVGSYVDTQIIHPWLFPEDDQQGPRLDSIQLSFASEGSPIARVYGSRMKVGGVAIWISDPRFVTTEEEIGKGGGETVETESIIVDLAVAFAETSTLPGEAIDGFEQVYFDGNLIWNEDTALNAGPSTELSVSKITKGIGSTAQSVMRISSTISGPDLGVFLSGIDATTTAFSNGTNNGTFRVMRSKTNTDGSSFMELDNTLATVEAAGASARVVQTGLGLDPGLASSIVFYNGDQTTADPTIASHETLVPVFKERAYFVINGLNLTQLGNRPPSSIEAVLRAETGPVTRATVIGQLFESSGRTSAEYDVSAVTGELKGMALRGPTAPANALTQIMAAYDVLVQDRGGTLHFFDRDQSDTITLTSDDLAAHERSSDDADRDVRRKDNKYRDAPATVNVTYVDEDNDLQNGSQTYRRVNVSTDQTVSSRFDLVLGADEAQCIARRLAWQSESNGKGMALQLPPSYMKAVESDLLAVTTDDGTLRNMLVRTIDTGDNHLRKYEGDEEIATASSFAVADCIVEDPDIFEQGIYVPPEMALYVMDIAPLTDGELSSPGFYWVTAPLDSGAVFAGASLYESKDDGATFTFKQPAPSKAVMGWATTVLAAPVDPFVLDEVSTVTVEMHNGELSTSTLANVLAGANRALVGEEIIGFVTATDNGDNTWTLSTLLRGLRDTDDEIDTHVVGERFVWLNGPGSQYMTLAVSALNQTRDYRSVPTSGVVSGFTTQEDDVTLQLRTLRPFAPGIVEGTRDGSNNLTITWERRTRAVYNSLSGNPVPQIEPSRVYEVDILDMPNPGATVLRTIIVVDTETASYLASEQTTDGLTPGDPVDLEVFQVSSAVGRSKPEPETV